MDNKEFGTRPILYISGPFSHSDPIHGINENILKASKIALEAWVFGWAALCPHKNTSGFQHCNEKWEIWMDGDISFIRRMSVKAGDALLMIPDWELSEGAKLERFIAEEMGIPVYEYEKDGMPTPLTTTF